MSLKPLTLAIVIPVYNEQDYLGPCLDAIAAQTVSPNEVIVVDNNSTDKSVEIAQSYKFVRVLHEGRQHQSFAQSTGFDAVKSDIIGRIDADSILEPDWVETAVEYLGNHKDCVAVSGRPEPYDIKAKRLGKLIFHFYHVTINRLFFGSAMLWGSGCAFRADIWPKIKAKATLSNKIWEDYDLSFLLMPYGDIKCLKDLIINCSFRNAYKPFKVQYEYNMRHINTVAIHRPKLRLITLLLVFGSKLIFIYPVAVLDKYGHKLFGHNAKI